MDGSQQVGIRLKVIGFGDPAANDWLVVNQFAIQGTRYNLRPDLVVYVNGLPLAVIELKNPASRPTTTCPPSSGSSAGRT
jgi:type I restriction enzyme R subunit